MKPQLNYNDMAENNVQYYNIWDAAKSYFHEFTSLKGFSLDDLQGSDS